MILKAQKAFQTSPCPSSMHATSSVLLDEVSMSRLNQRIDDQPSGTAMSLRRARNRQPIPASASAFTDAPFTTLAD
jgi:hypothetical protein